MIITLSIIGLLFISLIVGKINLSIKFNQQVKALFAQSKKISRKKYSVEQLIDLPKPVQQYFKLVLKEGQPYISYARLLHDGQFKTGLKKKWINIKGEQYFTIQKPGFIWKGTTKFFTARDMYIGNKGRLVVSLLSLINIVDAKGEKYNQGELLRWVSESVWFPTNLLPSEQLQWIGIDDKRAKLSFNYNNLSLYFIVSFNDIGEIEQLQTQRFMDDKNLEIWICKVSNYQEKNNVLVPTKAEAIWKIGKRNFSYARFNVLQLEYDKPIKF